VTRPCVATKQDGSPCKMAARGTSNYCWSHDPENAKRRREITSKAGKSKSLRAELVEVRNFVRDLTEKAAKGEVDKARSQVAFTGAGVWGRLVEIEKKLKDQEDIERRLEALEESRKQQESEGLEELEKLNVW
jgi:hypothetical protein